MAIDRAADERVVLCRIRAQLAAVPLPHVVEVMRPQPIEVLADLPPAVLGISRIRGEAVPVLDGAALVGRDGGGAAQRFVLLRAGTHKIALAVDGVLGVHALSRAERQSLPPVFGEQKHAKELAMHDRELVIVLGETRWISEELYSAILKKGERA